MIDLRHGLVKLADMIDWQVFEQEWAGCQRQSKSEPKGSVKCCHFGVGIIGFQTSASIRAAALVI